MGPIIPAAIATIALLLYPANRKVNENIALPKLKAEPKRAQKAEKRPAVSSKLELIGGVTAANVTSKSAVIAYSILDIGIHPIGQNNALLLIIKLDGVDPQGKRQSFTRMKTVHSTNVIGKEEFSRATMKENGISFDLMPDATYDIRISYAEVSFNVDLRAFNKPGDLLGGCTFKTPPEAAK